MPRLSRRSLLAVGIAALAALVFLWQLGASSFFLDEALTMKSADGPFSRLWHEVRLDENNPPTYYFLLHFWIRLIGSDAEWAVRLPSALACVALVLVVYRLGTLVGGARAGLVAALLAAVSPLLLEYAQQARVYALATLACAFAVLAAVEAQRRRSWTWVLVGAASGGLALSLHYFSVLVIGPLCVWMLFRRELGARMRAAFCAIPAVVWLAWLPLAVIQATDGRQAELGKYGNLTKGHAVRVLAGPFDDRYSTHTGALKAAAAAVILVAIVWTALRSRRPSRPDLQLLVGLVLISIGALVVAAGAGKELLNSRYMTFVAPLMLVVVGVTIARTAGRFGIVMLGVLLVAGIAGVIGSYRRSAFYPDARGATDAIAAARRPGDVVLHAASLGIWYPFEYYARRRLPAGTPVLTLFDPRVPRLLMRRPRVWIVRDEVTGGASGPSPPGYRQVAVRRFPGAVQVTLVLELPQAPRP